jgi:hypothetical protein
MAMFRLDHLSCRLTVLALQDGSKPQKSRYRSLFRVLAGAPREKLELDNASFQPDDTFQRNRCAQHCFCAWQP